MTEERSCKNCGIFNECPGCPSSLINWQPIAQEKPVENKVIFESEEEFANYWFSCGIGNVGSHEYNVVKRRSIEHGYIRKSAVEEAEQWYKDWYDDKESNPEIVMDKMYLAIQNLKSEIARLKK